MNEKIPTIVNETYNEIIENLSFLWPNSNNASSWPHENNIGIALINVARKYGFNKVYSECKIAGARRDLVLINEKEKIFLQIELKHLYDTQVFEEKIGDDLWRIYKKEYLDIFFNSTERNTKFKEYAAYGLFLGFGMNKTYLLWDVKNGNVEEIKKYFQECGHEQSAIEHQINNFKNWFSHIEDGEPALSGVFRNENLNDEYFGNLWLCYYFVKCGYNS